MTIFDAGGLEDRRGTQVGDWHPSRYTPSLSGTEEFPSQGDKLLRFARLHWSIPESERFTLYAWQEWLIRHVLEQYPEDWPVAHLRGQLRFRQVVISMGRQNGKSLLAALLVLYFLVLHVRGPRIIGLASIDRQAKIVYDRVKFGIDASQALSREIKTTATRGITRKDGSGVYQTLPAKEDSAQGEPASGAIYDELHLGLAALWDALVLAMRAKRNALLLGITTAGDDGSLLLIRLYREGQAAIDGADERFGFFCWEAPSDDLTEDGVIAANPTIAEGGIPLDLAMAEATKMYNDLEKGPDGLTGRQRCIRYTLNRFVEGASDAWASTTAWTNTARDTISHDGRQIVYGLDRTTDWSHASITATSHLGGLFRTGLVASFDAPSHDTMLEACARLARRPGRAVFAMDATMFKALGRDLRERGFEVWMLGADEMHQSSQHAAAAIARQAVSHPGDTLVAFQMARGRRRVSGDTWRISRGLSGSDVDTVVGFIVSAYVAAVRPPDAHQLF